MLIWRAPLAGPSRLEFIGISSYGKGKTSSGEVKLTKDLDTSVQDADVLVVEDIEYSRSYPDLSARGSGAGESREASGLPPSLISRNAECGLFWLRMSDSLFRDQFVVGYGLDYAEDYRQLQDVCILDSN